MAQQIKIKNHNLFHSETLEKLVRNGHQDAKIKTYHQFNKIEIQNSEINTEITIDKQAEVIEVNSEVKGTGMKLWLFVVLALPYRMLDMYQIIDFHFVIEIMYYGLSFSLAFIPGIEKAKSWERARKNKEKEICVLIEKLNTKFKLKEKSRLDNDLYKKEIQLLMGKRIKEVSYILEDEFHYDYDFAHLVDLGIIFKFEDDKFMSYKFEKEEIDFKDDILIPQRYDIKFINIFEESECNQKNVSVSDNPNWNQLTTEPIIDIKIYSQEVGNRKIVTDLVFETATNRVVIFSVGEQIENEGKLEVDLSIGNDLAIVVFDEETIKSSERIEN